MTHISQPVGTADSIEQAAAALSDKKSSGSRFSLLHELASTHADGAGISFFEALVASLLVSALDCNELALLSRTSRILYKVVIVHLLALRAAAEDALREAFGVSSQQLTLATTATAKLSSASPSQLHLLGRLLHRGSLFRHLSVIELAPTDRDAGAMLPLAPFRDASTSRLCLCGTGLSARHMLLLAPTIASLPMVRTLWLSNNRIDDAGVSAFAAALAKAHTLQLEQLHLSWNQIGDAGMCSLVDSLVKSPIRNLSYLNLARNEIGDAGLGAFAAAWRCEQLRNLAVLQLADNLISDAGMVALGKRLMATPLTSLRKVDVSWNRIGSHGVRALADLVKAASPDLLSFMLCFQGNKFSAASEKLLKKASRACQPRLVLYT
uniref:Uncharacterized protein n=1 Tax=Chrysotila carterae TaxID=13221 RepID=A0A7S4C162_CHRCT